MGARSTDRSQWRNRPLASYLDDAVAADPDKESAAERDESRS